MKMFYGNVPIKNLNVKKFDVNTSDATMIASDLQAGVTAYARGQKITGTGKCFEFANYGFLFTNVAIPVPSMINVVEIASLDYPVQISIALNDMRNIDFSNSQMIGNIIIDGVAYPVNAFVLNGKITISCEKTIKLQVFYGRDNYI